MKLVTLNVLSLFLSELKMLFANINHTHTVNDIENLSVTMKNIQSDVDSLEQTVTNLAGNMQYNILPITQSEYDALTTVDENTLYIIEV